MPALQTDIEVTLRLLEGFDGLASLKKLQAHLNFDREDAAISRRSWAESNTPLLVADPVITASVGGRSLFGADGEQSFKVIYCQLASTELLLTHERAVVAELLVSYPYALFVFSDNDQQRFHFVNVKDEPQGLKRKLFRRITVGNGERLRTAAEQLSRLDGEQLARLSLSEIQRHFDEAFDVGPVTKKFFDEYKRVFELVKASVIGFDADEAGIEKLNLFTQRLFNRLMFLAFIQKKGWLKFGESADYLCSLWNAHVRNTPGTRGNFYSDRLMILFFEGLGAIYTTENVERAAEVAGLIGSVPYLNGGLFESDEDDLNLAIVVGDEGLDQVINGLFEQFNFTITEATPLDVEVAVDPEMLGKIFEELVTGRHESGSYYTPKPIVSFMCREALKGFLGTAVPSESPESLARFVDEHDGAVQHPEDILAALQDIAVCDPACGSGAYLLGMLHELLDLRQCLFVTRNLDAKSIYDRKLEIISKNVYGVDVDQFAVNIARLRLWLSLAVDFKEPEPRPLPNLDYKIESGDSIASIAPGVLQIGLYQNAIEEMLVLKREYLRAHHEEKLRLRDQISILRSEIRTLSGRPTRGFDWVIDFAEVFAHNGFDIVVANPPYINAIDFKKSFSAEYRAAINNSYQSATGAYDFYIPFFERALQLLKAGGQLAFITPNKYLSAKYAAGLRSYLLNSATLLSIADLSAAEVFSSASVYPVLTFIAKGATAGPYEVKGYRLRDPNVPDLSSLEAVTFSSTLLILLPENIWGFLLSDDVPLLAKLLEFCVPMQDLGQINATSTAGEAERYTDLLSEVDGPNKFKALNTGTIDPLQALWGEYAMVHSGLRLLNPYLDVSSPGVNERRREMYQSPKVVFGKMGRMCEAVLDHRGEYASMNTNCFYEPMADGDLEFIAAYANSKLFIFLYDQFFRALRMAGGYYQFQAPQLRVMPVPVFDHAIRAEIGSYATAISACDTDAERQELFTKMNLLILENCHLTQPEQERILAQ